MAALEIPPQEISYHATSYCDRMGRVFWWRGGLYRGIDKDYVPFYRRIFENGVVKSLVEKQFIVETELTDMVMERYPLVLKHQPLPFVSFASKWCPEMLRDAGLFIADFMLELARYDLTLADASTYDLLFDGSQPLQVDFTTIVAADNDGDRSWKYFRDDFMSYYIWPVRLAAQGYGRLIRWLLAEYNQTATLELIALMEKRNSNAKTGRISAGLIAKARKNQPARFDRLGAFTSILAKPIFAKGNVHILVRGVELVQQLRGELERLTLPPPRSNLVPKDAADLAFKPSSGWTQKQSSVHKILAEVRPNSVIDLGCGWGWYSQLAASLGSQVVAIDNFEKVISSFYTEIKKRNLPILALVMDSCNPSPGLGASNRVLPPATQRLVCDLVLALSLVEHLVLEDHMTFDQIAETFASFSNKWALIEFVPCEDRELREKCAQWHSWYTLDRFLNSLQKWFRTIRILPSQVEPRTLLLCEK